MLAAYASRSISVECFTAGEFLQSNQTVCY
jgi:hypothetical protein